MGGKGMDRLTRRETRGEGRISAGVQRSDGRRLGSGRMRVLFLILVTLIIIYSDFSSSTPLAIPGFTGPLASVLGLVPRAGLGVAIALLGFPVYWLWKGRWAHAA